MSSKGHFVVGLGFLVLVVAAGAAATAKPKIDRTAACPFSAKWRECSNPARSAQPQIMVADKVQPICVSKAMIWQVAQTVKTGDAAAFKFLTGGGGCGVLPEGTAVSVVGQDSGFTRVTLTVNGDTLTGWVLTSLLRLTS